MPTRQCINGHHVTDDAAAFCPLCGARMPPIPTPSARPAEADPVDRRRRGRYLLWLGGGLLFLCVVCWGAYEASGGSQAAATREATRTAVAAATARAPSRAPQPWPSERRMPTPGPSPRRSASATAIPAETPTPTATPLPTYDLVSCTPDLIYISDVTIADGASFPAGEELYKAWEVRNSGGCSWGPGLHLRSVGSEALVIEPVVSVPELVPGEEGVVGVALRVPEEAGRYKSEWRLCAAEDQCFGTTLFADIRSVGIPTATPTAVRGARLQATVSFTGTQFRITNRGDYDWTEVRFRLNPSGGLFSSRAYMYELSRVGAGEEVTIGAALFVLPDGTRFDPFRIKPMEFLINCREGSASFGW